MKRRSSLITIFALTLSGAMVATLLWWAPSGAAPLPQASASAASTSSLPTISEIPAGTGTHGYPFDTVPSTALLPGAPAINLSALGYVEHEFTMSGVTNEYQPSGLWLPNGDWGVSVAQSNVPYTTRLLVRYPTNPAKFNGTVVFEWLNDTTGSDEDPVWAELYNQLLDNGYAYVGVTAQSAGMADLKAWDVARYGSLGDSSDSQSYDIFSQAAEAVKADSATLLGGLTPKNLIGTGDSQSAFRIDTYVNAIQPVSHAFNGFLAVGRAAAAAPLGNGLLMPLPFPALIRTDNTAPFIQLNTQGDVEELDDGAARQPDNNDLRTWELAGASHIDEHEAAYELETEFTEMPTEPIPDCLAGTPAVGLTNVNQADNMPLFEVEDAAIAALQTWITAGVQPPHSPPISTTPLVFGLLNLVNTNSYGIAGGGIQLPEAQVPAESYSPINLANIDLSTVTLLSLLNQVEAAITLLTTGTGSLANTAGRDEGLCLLSGYFNDLSSATLTSLYPTHASYVAKYTAAVNAEEAAGFLTPADGAAAIANAQASSIP